MDTHPTTCPVRNPYCSQRISILLQQRWFMAQLSVYLVNSSLHLLATTSLPDPSSFVSNLRTRLQAIRPPPPRQSQRNSNIPDGLLPRTFSSAMMLYVNLFNHLTMDHTKSSNALTSTSHSTSMDVSTLFISTVSSLPTSVLIYHNPPHKLHSQPLYHVPQLVLDVVSTSPSISLIPCLKTQRGERCSELNVH